VKKKIMKPSEKFRFNFDWEAADDTSRDLNPLYNNTHEAALLYGRGLRAGVDRREQKKQAAEFEQKMMKKIRESQVCGRAFSRPILAHFYSWFPLSCCHVFHLCNNKKGLPGVVKPLP
jgi:hypothetical protein